MIPRSNQRPSEHHNGPGSIPDVGTAPRLLRYKQAAEVLQVSERTVFTLVKTGKLMATRFGKSVRIDRHDLDAFIERAKARKAVGRGE